MEYPLSSTYGARSALFLQSADDYHRHRHRINKKLKHLRRSLNIQTKDSKHYAEKEKISSISSENYAMDSKFGEVILLQIERDLIYAEETRLLLNVRSSKAKEKFLISKYKKSIVNAKKLLKVTTEERDTDRVLELLAYIAIIEGYLKVSRKKWSVAINAFSVARIILQFLYQHEKLPEGLTKELYLDLIDNIVDPALSLSLSQASIKQANLLLVSKNAVSENKIDYLQKAIDIISRRDPSFVKVSSSENASEKLIDSIKWLNYEAQLSSDELAKSIMKCNKEEAKVKENDPSTYDVSLINWQDAITIHTQEMERSNNDADAEDDDENQDKYIISTYLNYNYLLLRIRRDIALYENLQATYKKKTVSRTTLLETARDSLKMLQNVIKSIEEIKELPGVANDDDLNESLDKLDVYFQSLKLYKLAQAYLISNKYKESLALLNESHKQLSKIDSILQIDSSVDDLLK
ncbi:unnamed protein product [Ambrosiozyma monospora]|uniref:Unnamed protein product n=1 Tax=Ambrosiozyma monospora TaxID=43982 RepID=A0ACB5T4P4_AMBMO|nr:unnamed protein product [Ambrosiozyma monospora]